MTMNLSPSQSMNLDEYAQRAAPGPTTSISSSHRYNTPPNPGSSRPSAAQATSSNMIASASSSVSAAAASSFSPLPVAAPNSHYATQQHCSPQAQGQQSLSSYPHQSSGHPTATMQQPFYQQHSYSSHHPLSSSATSITGPHPLASTVNMPSYGYPPPPHQTYPSSYPQQSQGFPQTMAYGTKSGPGPGITSHYPRTLSSSSSYSATSTSASATGPPHHLSNGVGTGTGNSNELVSPASALSEPSVRTPASADGLGFPPPSHGSSTSTSLYPSVHVGGMGGSHLPGHVYQHQSQIGQYAQANPALPSPHVTIAQPPTPSMMMPGGGGGGGGIGNPSVLSQSNMAFGTGGIGGAMGGGMGPPPLQEQFTGKTIHTPEDMNEYRRMLSAAQRHGQMHSFDASSGGGGGPPGPGGMRSRSGSTIGSGTSPMPPMSSPGSRTGTAAGYRSHSHPPPHPLSASSTASSPVVASHPYYSSSNPHPLPHQQQHQASFQQQQQPQHQRIPQPYMQGIMTNTSGYSHPHLQHPPPPPPPSATTDIMTHPTSSSSSSTSTTAPATGSNATYWHASAPPSSITDHKVYLPTPNNPRTSSSLSFSPPPSASSGGSIAGPAGVAGIAHIQQQQQYGTSASPTYDSTALHSLQPTSMRVQPHLPTQAASSHNHHHHQAPHLPNSIRTRKPERPKLLIEQSFSPPPTSPGTRTVEDECSNIGGGAVDGAAAGDKNEQVGAGARSSPYVATAGAVPNANANPQHKATSPSAPTSAAENRDNTTPVGFGGGGGEPNGTSTTARTNTGAGAGEGVGEKTDNGNMSIYTSLNGFALPGAAGAGAADADTDTGSTVAMAHQSSVSGSAGGSMHEHLTTTAVADPNVTTGQSVATSTSNSSASSISTTTSPAASSSASAATQIASIPRSVPATTTTGGPATQRPQQQPSPTSPERSEFVSSISPSVSVIGTGTGTESSRQKNQNLTEAGADILPATPTSSTHPPGSGFPPSSSSSSAFLQSRAFQQQRQLQYQHQLMQHHGAQWRQHVNTQQSQQAHMAARQQRALGHISLPHPPVTAPAQHLHPGDAPGSSAAAGGGSFGVSDTYPSHQPASLPFSNYEAPQNPSPVGLQSAPGGSHTATWAPGQPYQQQSPFSEMHPPAMNVNVNMNMPSPIGQFNAGGDQYRYQNPMQSSAHPPGYPTMSMSPSSEQPLGQRLSWQALPEAHGHQPFASTGTGAGTGYGRGAYGPYVPPPPLQYSTYRQPTSQQPQPGFGYYPPQTQSQRGFDDWPPPPPYEARPLRVPPGGDPGDPMILASLPGQPPQDGHGRQQHSVQSSSSFGHSAATSSSTPTTPAANQTRAPRSPQRGRRTPFFMRPPTPEPEMPGQRKIERFHPISENSKIGGELKYVGFEIHEAYALSSVPITHPYKFAADRGAKGAAARAANSAGSAGSANAHGNGAATTTNNSKKRKAPPSSRRSGRRTTNARKPMMLDDTDDDVPGPSKESSTANNQPTAPKPLRPRRKASEKIFNAGLAPPEEDDDDEYFSDEDEPEKEDSDDDYVDDAPVRPVKKRGRRAAVSDNEEDNNLEAVPAAGNTPLDGDSVTPLSPSPSRTKLGRPAKHPRSPNNRRDPVSTAGRPSRK